MSYYSKKIDFYIYLLAITNFYNLKRDIIFTEFVKMLLKNVHI